MWIGWAPTRQHELDHTDHTDQEYICPAWQIDVMKSEFDDLFEVWQLFVFFWARLSLTKHNIYTKISVGHALPHIRVLSLAHTNASLLTRRVT